jgi:hypothetical protein
LLCYICLGQINDFLKMDFFVSQLNNFNLYLKINFYLFGFLKFLRFMNYCVDNLDYFNSSILVMLELKYSSQHFFLLWEMILYLVLSLIALFLQNFLFNHLIIKGFLFKLFFYFFTRLKEFNPKYLCSRL